MTKLLDSVRATCGAAKTHGAGMFVTMARALVSLFNRLVPKQSKAVLAGFPDMEDSIVELARQIALRRDLAIVVLVDRTRGNLPAKLPTGVIVCRRKSLAGLFHYVTAKYVFFTHGLYLSPRPPASQICVNVWHGMPIKRIGHMLGRTPPPSTFVLATSDMFRGLVGQSFGVSGSRILVTGIPRNDVLVRASSHAQTIKNRLGIDGRRGGPRLIVWLPTYRKAVRGIVRTDGQVHQSIFGMDDLDPGSFSDFLEAQNCLCIIKPHPMAADFADRHDSPGLKIWRDGDLDANGISLYELVGAADLLITDASSVYVDYLILDKPVVIAFPDLDEYRHSRGFALEPIEEYFAGPVVSTYDQLMQAIVEGLTTDPFSYSRSRLAACFHKHRDALATSRLLNEVVEAKPIAATGATVHA